MNIILVALLIIIAIAAIAVLVWFLDAKFNSLYARLNDLQMPGNGLEEPSQDQSEAPESESKPCAQKPSLEWVEGRAYKTREGERVVLERIDKDDALLPHRFSDGWWRQSNGRAICFALNEEIIDYWPDDVTAPISETEKARDMAGVAPVSLYEKRAQSTYWKRKSDGVCAHCGKTPAKAGRVLCAKCNRTNNIRQRARYKERIESGE